MLALRDEIARIGQQAQEARVTVVRSGALGDTILLLPAVDLLRGALPSARVTVVGSPWAERLAPLMARPWTPFPFESPALLPLFAREGCDDASGVFKDADLVVIYSSDPEGLFVRNVQRLCQGTVVCHPVEPPAGVHAACHLAAALTREPPSADGLPLPGLRPPGEDRPRAGPVVLHPGSGGEWKCWPPERFAELAQRLDARVALLEGPADGSACGVVRGYFPAAEIARSSDLEDAAALIASATLYVGNDSGVTHMAAALGTPTVAVFGPTDPAVWRPLGRSVRVVRGRRGWPSVEEVCEAADQLLSERRRQERGCRGDDS